MPAVWPKKNCTGAGPMRIQCTVDIMNEIWTNRNIISTSTAWPMEIQWRALNQWEFIAVKLADMGTNSLVSCLRWRRCRVWPCRGHTARSRRPPSHPCCPYLQTMKTMLRLKIHCHENFNLQVFFILLEVLYNTACSLTDLNPWQPQSMLWIALIWVNPQKISVTKYWSKYVSMLECA